MTFAHLYGERLFTRNDCWANRISAIDAANEWKMEVENEKTHFSSLDSGHDEFGCLP